LAWAFCALQNTSIKQNADFTLAAPIFMSDNYIPARGKRASFGVKEAGTLSY
jgi:hypothetical protein